VVAHRLAFVQWGVQGRRNSFCVHWGMFPARPSTTHLAQFMSENTTDQITENDPPFKDGSSSFGSFYPKNYVLAVFNTDADAAAAGDALHSAGFAADDVIVASGKDVVAHQHAVKEEQTIFARIGEQWSKLYTDESADARAMIDFAERGAAFVLAYAPEDEQTNRAVAALRTLHPPVMRKYGTLAITEQS
jgi:hypothetical protein